MIDDNNNIMISTHDYLREMMLTKQASSNIFGNVPRVQFYSTYYINICGNENVSHFLEDLVLAGCTSYCMAQIIYIRIKSGARTVRPLKKYVTTNNKFVVTNKKLLQQIKKLLEHFFS